MLLFCMKFSKQKTNHSLDNKEPWLKLEVIETWARSQKEALTWVSRDSFHCAKAAGFGCLEQITWVNFENSMLPHVDRGREPTCINNMNLLLSVQAIPVISSLMCVNHQGRFTTGSSTRALLVNGKRHANEVDDVINRLMHGFYSFS